MKNTYNIIIIIKLNNQKLTLKTLIIIISYLCNCIIYQVAFVLMVNKDAHRTIQKSESPTLSANLKMSAVLEM